MRVITVNGYLAADAEVKMSKQGNQYVRFRMANHEYNEDNAHWYSVTSNIPFHVTMAKYFKKGSSLTVIGDYSDEIYTSKVTGMCDISRNIRACSISFTGDGRSKTDETTTTTPTSSTKVQTVKEVNMGTLKPMQTTKQVQAPVVVDDEDDDLPF